MAVDLDTWAKAAEERLSGAPLEREPCRPGGLLHKIPRSRLAGQRALWKKLARWRFSWQAKLLHRLPGSMEAGRRIERTRVTRDECYFESSTWPDSNGSMSMRDRTSSL